MLGENVFAKGQQAEKDVTVKHRMLSVQPSVCCRRGDPALQACLTTTLNASLRTHCTSLFAFWDWGRSGATSDSSRMV